MVRIALALLVVLGLGLLSVVARQSDENPHGNLKWDCQDCHSTDSWKITAAPSNFSHDETGYPLLGEHEDISCRSCHSDLQFNRVGVLCADCHKDVHLGQFGSNCQTCHSPLNWQNRRDIFDQHAQVGFPLTGPHTAVDCDACHVGSRPDAFTGTATDCRVCHIRDYEATSEPNHQTVGFSTECQTCHLPSNGSWRNATFAHSANFPLTGGHANLECQRCHTDGITALPTDCYSCHGPDFAAALDPNHEQGGYDHNCTMCHTTTAWTPASFDHASMGFPLLGAHAQATCLSCHSSGYAGTPTACYSCHQNDFTGVTEPNHVLANFDHNCVTCHGFNAWSPSTFDHAGTQFPLQGKHAEASCSACHATTYAGTPTDCFSCHQSDFESAGSPNHVQNNFDHDCTSCHSFTGWSPSSFDHSATQFPLQGAHTAVSCVSCHATSYTGTPIDCWSCHQSDFTGTTDPNHVLAGFDHDCTKCHGLTSWGDGDFNHAATQFPLTGAHSQATCLACHATAFAGTSTACFSCHEAAFTSSSNPSHVQNNFDHDCTVCHNNSAWIPSTFDHGATLFPLQGAHASASCISCHVTSYAGTPTTCFSCHQADFDGTTDPNHALASFDHDCTRCHGYASWDGASFDHSSTGFQLTGAHLQATCLSCHATAFAGTATECYSCHQTDFAGVADPNHVQANFDHVCTTCHTTTAWQPATFDHAITQFPLLGVHAQTTCMACHATGYTGTPTACYSCHQTDFAGAADPNHVLGNFDHDCTKCHGYSAWSPASIDHNATQFPLTGAHLQAACVACHTTSYTGTPTACYACHQSDYSGTTDPAHVAAGFGTDCTVCHTTSAWTPSTWDHDAQYFPIYSGTHAGRWSTCGECHIVPSNFATFSCIDCHEHNRTDTDNDHSQVNGYQYLSTACYTCHPRGNH